MDVADLNFNKVLDTDVFHLR